MVEVDTFNVSSYLLTSKMTGVTLLLLLAYLLAILTNLLTTLAHLDRSDLPSWEEGNCVRLANRAMKSQIREFLLNDNIYKAGAMRAKIF